MADFFADIIALSPALFWKGEETAGTTANDSSGNGRNGTYTGSVFTLGQASLIPNKPLSKSFNVDGTDVWAAIADAAALDPGSNFTAICVIKPSSLAAQRDIIGKIDCWQIWLETNGQLNLWISPQWTNFQSTNDAAGKLLANTTYVIGVRQNSVTGKLSVWINGVKNNEVNKATALTNTAGEVRMGGSSTGGGRSFLGNMQAFAYWPSTALADADMLALYNSFNTVPPAPTDPTPLDTNVISASLVTAEWPISVDGDNTSLIAVRSGGSFVAPTNYAALAAAHPAQAVAWITERKAREEDASATLVCVDLDGVNIRTLTGVVCADLTTAGINADPIGLNKALRTLCAKTLEVLYDLEYFNGSTGLWVSLGTSLNILRFDWSPPIALRGRTDVKLRVRGICKQHGGISNWVESSVFTIPDYVPTSIVVTPGNFTTVTWENGGFQTEAEYWDGAFWRTLFALTALETFTWDTQYRKGTGVKVRLRTDDAGVKSAWVESSTFTLTGVYIGSYWVACARVGTLELLWKMNEGNPINVCADSSGNGRNSDVPPTTNMTAGNASLIPNRPADTHRARTAPFGSGIIFTRVGVQGWMATIRSSMMVIKPSASLNNIQQMLLVNRFQILNIGAQLCCTVSGQAGQLNYSSAPAIGSVSHLGMSIEVGRHAAILNGAVVGTRSISALPAGGQDLGIGDAAATEGWQAIALWSTELDALNFAWLYNVKDNPPNDPPTTPGAFTQPLGGNTYDLSIAVAWGASTDPNSDPIEYYGEYFDPNLGTWQQLFNWQSATTFAWDTSHIVIGVGFQVRVKARDQPTQEESLFQTSGSFTIAHARAVPNVPIVEWVWEYDFFLGFTAIFSSSVPAATLRKVHWRLSDVSDMSHIVTSWISEGGTGTLGITPYDLVACGSVDLLIQDPNHWTDAQLEDDIGNLGPRSAPVRAKTAIMAGTIQGIFARDASGHARHGVYGFTTGTDGASYLNLGAGSVGNRYPGHKLPGMPAWVRGFHPQLGQGKIRYQAADNSPAGVAVPNAWNWAILVRVVLDTPGHPLYGTALCGFADALHHADPLGTPGFGSLVAYGTALELRHSGAIHRVPIANLVLNEPTTLKIVCKSISPDKRADYEALHPEAFHYTGGEHTQLFYVNNVLVYDTGNPLLNHTPLGPLLAGWLDIAGLGSPFISGVNSMWQGAIIEWCLWTHPEIDGSGGSLNDSLDMPALFGLSDLSPASIIATQPQLYYQLNDPQPPDRPTAQVLP